MHGYDLAPEDHALLRGAPPPAALRWAVAAISPGGDAEVVSAVALEGGTSSAVHALDVRERGGAERRLVLRRFVRQDWLEEEPDAPLREAAALTAMRSAVLATPELIALDADGASAGAPALLMTRLHGATVWEPRDLDDYLRGLAAVLPSIHATPVPPGAHLSAYSDWGLHLDRPPAASALAAGVWERAFAVFERTPPAGGALVHRDYHPGNVLWAAGAVSGVVDWASTSVGHPDADVGHCRENLARAFDLAAADRFLAHHRELTGAGDYDPYWDVVALLGGYAQDDVSAWSAREDALLAQAVAGL